MCEITVIHSPNQANGYDHSHYCTQLLKKHAEKLLNFKSQALGMCAVKQFENTTAKCSVRTNIYKTVPGCTRLEANFS